MREEKKHLFKWITRIFSKHLPLCVSELVSHYFPVINNSVRISLVATCNHKTKLEQDPINKCCNQKKKKTHTFCDHIKLCMKCSFHVHGLSWRLLCLTWSEWQGWGSCLFLIKMRWVFNKFQSRDSQTNLFDAFGVFLVHFNRKMIAHIITFKYWLCFLRLKVALYKAKDIAKNRLLKCPKSAV